jgi:hypothetical protein
MDGDSGPALPATSSPPGVYAFRNCLVSSDRSDDVFSLITKGENLSLCSCLAWKSCCQLAK